MKVIILGLVMMSSLSAFAGGTCEIGRDAHFTNAKTFSLNDEINGPFVQAKLEEYPSLAIKMRENSDRRALISLEINGVQEFFVIGKEEAYLSYYPNKNNRLENIRVKCVLE